MITIKHKNFFKNNGFIIIKSKKILYIKNKIRSELKKKVFFFLKKNNLKILFKGDFDNLIKYIYNIDRKKNINILKTLYEIFPSIPFFYNLCNEKFFINLTKKLYIQNPTIGTGPQIRIDRPHTKKYLTLDHQDYWYSFLSDNALTIWFNLTSIDNKDGPLVIYEKSHKNGIIPFNNSKKYKFSAKSKIKFITKKIFLKENEILVFNQYLLHKSGYNFSKKPRISIQLRYNDLNSLKVNTSSFIFASSSYVVNKQKKSKKKF